MIYDWWCDACKCHMHYCTCGSNPKSKSIIKLKTKKKRNNNNYCVLCDKPMRNSFFKDRKGNPAHKKCLQMACQFMGKKL